MHTCRGSCLTDETVRGRERQQARRDWREGPGNGGEKGVDALRAEVWGRGHAKQTSKRAECIINDKLVYRERDLMWPSGFSVCV